MAIQRLGKYRLFIHRVVCASEPCAWEPHVYASQEFSENSFMTPIHIIRAMSTLKDPERVSCFLPVASVSTYTMFTAFVFLTIRVQLFSAPFLAALRYSELNC